MASPTAVSPLVMRILAASVTVSHKAGDIIRGIMKSGNLGIVEKVNIKLHRARSRSTTTIPFRQVDAMV